MQDYIPAVGDIDAFIKVPRPDGLEEELGKHILVSLCTCKFFDLIQNLSKN